VTDDPKKDPQFAYTLAKGLQVLSAFGAGEARLSNREIAAATGIARSTVARLTRTLSLLGYLKYDPSEGRCRTAVCMLTAGVSAAYSAHSSPTCPAADAGIGSVRPRLGGARSARRRGHRRGRDRRREPCQRALGPTSASRGRSSSRRSAERTWRVHRPTSANPFRKASGRTRELTSPSSPPTSRKRRRGTSPKGSALHAIPTGLASMRSPCPSARIPVRTSWSSIASLPRSCFARTRSRRISIRASFT